MNTTAGSGRGTYTKKEDACPPFFVLCAYSCKEMQIQLLKHSLKFGIHFLTETFITLIGRQHLLVHFQAHLVLNNFYNGLLYFLLHFIQAATYLLKLSHIALRNPICLSRLKLGGDLIESFQLHTTFLYLLHHLHLSFLLYRKHFSYSTYKVVDLLFAVILYCLLLLRHLKLLRLKWPYGNHHRCQNQHQNSCSILKLHKTLFVTKPLNGSNPKCSA